MIPFSPPRIDQKVIDEVVDTLKSGWITTGPKTKEFERRLTAYCGNKATLAVNSNTVGLEGDCAGVHVLCHGECDRALWGETGDGGCECG